MVRSSLATQLLEIVMLRIRSLWTLACLAIFLASPASATPLNLTLGLPDVVSGFIDVTYDAGTQTFTASGFSLEIDDDGVAPNLALDASGSFSVIATIDNSGNLVSGTVTITGTRTPAPSYGSPLVATSSLTGFGFNASGTLFEFTYTTAAGSSIGSAGSQGGIILAATTTYTSWGSDFDNLIASIPGTGSGTADTAPVVPEPSAAILVALALGYAWRRR